MADTTLRDDLGAFFDPEWYLSEYPDVAKAGIDPLDHFLNHGAAENRNPNPFFDADWYLSQNPDVGRAELNPLLHYLQYGAAELRNPHPRFDATFYADEHPEAADNPLLYHVLQGVHFGWPTERRVNISEYLPAKGPLRPFPAGIEVDVVIPAYRGLTQTRRCLESVLADPDRPPGKIIVVDDHSPEPKLSAWLDAVNATGRIRLIRHRRNMGFIVSVNRGMAASDRADVVLLNSDTEVPPRWLSRLAAHAYSGPRIGSVSPFSNNATICSYPTERGGQLAFGRPLAQLDAACREANAGRSVEVPTTVGYCMYIRRDCLREIGPFDAKTFGRGYGEENDFCMRASAGGWTHLLACDTFVYHEGRVSFGLGSTDLDGKQNLILARHPHFAKTVARHVRRDRVGPYRFAATAALFRRSGLPTILLVTHELGGGVRQHIESVVARTAGRANFLLLSASPRGVSITALGHEHPCFEMAEDREEDLAEYLRSAGVSRVHIHHVLGLRLDLHSLISRLGVPFDFTAHDFMTICPQINMLPRRDGQYCGGPGPAVCNSCIAERPELGARDILSWRAEHAWLLREAERIICPSVDARERLARYGLSERAIVAPHEAVAKKPWPIRIPALRSRSLRVVLLGVLADHKGARAVSLVLAAADPAEIEFRLIGYAESDLSCPQLPDQLEQSGPYEAEDLPELIARVRPHAIWFPAQWPETYSYTLSAAIETGLPIVASQIGAFKERLQGRPFTWLIDPGASAAEWLAAFDEVRSAIKVGRPSRTKLRAPVQDFYAKEYLPRAPAAIRSGPLDLRRPGRTTVVVVPERLETGVLSPCAYIRLLLPLDHLASSGDIELVLARPEEALRLRADILATQRHAPGDLATAERIAAHCAASGMRLLYDIDDDLLGVPADHPDAASLRPRSATVQALVRLADTVSVSTEPLRSRLQKLRKDAVLVPNALDERLWCALPQAGRAPFSPLCVLFMGTQTHDPDLALVMPALERLHAEFAGRVAITVLGVTSQALPDWIVRPRLPLPASASYPGFVNWFIQQNAWDVGIAPLADTAFSRCKSAIKAMDYAAIGLAILASDVALYRGSLADGAAGMLVPDDALAWFESLSRLATDWNLLARLRAGAREAFAAVTLAAQAEQRRRVWLEPAGSAKPRAAA